MKAKKICALLIAGALAVGTVSALAACKKDDNEKQTSTDTRLWYAVGRDTKGTLSKFDNFYPQDTSVAFERDTTVTSENVFTLSLDIYAAPAGYGFKFLYKTSADEVIEESTLWTRQIGINNFAGVEGEGANAVIKNDKGEVVFTTKDGMDANNLYLAKGHEGTYKFTLKTTSDTDDSPVITWEKTAKIDVTHDMYINGDMNNFGGAREIPMSENVNGENITWTKQLDVTKDDLCRDADGKLVKEGAEYAALHIFNDIDKKSYIDETATVVEIEGAYEKGDKVKANLLKEGKYNISFDQKTGKLSITEIAYQMYFIGDMNGWKQADENYTLNVDATGMIWTGKLSVAEETNMKLFNSKGLTDSDKYIPGGLGNITLSAGDWFFKFDANTGKVEYELSAYYVVGTFDYNFSVQKDVMKLTATETKGVYTYEIVIDKDAKTVKDEYGWIKENVCALKCVYGTELGGKDNLEWYNPEGSENYMVTELGTYVVTLTLTYGEDGKVTKGVTSVAPKA